ncbi:5-bromo-4-chloroindolyl phosphate hydrolysis family protein [Staphylococcus haemolyticus]
MSYFPTQRLTSRKYLTEIGLSRRDYHYVSNHLKQAQDKIRTILKSFVNVRSIQDFRQINDIYKFQNQFILLLNKGQQCFLK